MGASAFWFHSRPYGANQLVQMLPPDRANYLYIDVDAIRAFGILDQLAGAKAIEEAEYQKFVKEIGFDYRQDLDNVAVAFREGEIFYAAQGRFDWPKLEAYASAHGGNCERFMCTVAGSVPGRDISYYMPRNGILAMAVSKTSTAGDMVAPGSWRDPPRIAEVGAWAFVRPALFSDLSVVPAFLHPWIVPLAQTNSVVFTLSTAKDRPADFELRMQATAKDEASAKKLADQYSKMTAAKDLLSIFDSGKFSAEKTDIIGTWPIPRSALLSVGQ